MPVIKSAKKKLRKDRKRTEHNEQTRDTLKMLLKTARKNPTEKTISAVQQAIDKAVKKHILHKNKAARIKSVLTKQTGKEAKTTPKKRKSSAKNAKNAKNK